MQEINFDRGRWAPATQRAYRNSWARFCAFCAARAANPLPPGEKTVADFLWTEAEDHSTSAISGRLAAIVAVCNLAGMPLRVNETIIRDAWAEIRRVKGTAKKPKAALDDKAIIRIASNMPPEVIRDRAIILFAYASLMRRSEIAALNREDIVISETAMIITIRRSKADKTPITTHMPAPISIGEVPIRTGPCVRMACSIM